MQKCCHLRARVRCNKCSTGYSFLHVRVNARASSHETIRCTCLGERDEDGIFTTWGRYSDEPGRRYSQYLVRIDIPDCEFCRVKVGVPSVRAERRLKRKMDEREEEQEKQEKLAESRAHEGPRHDGQTANPEVPRHDSFSNPLSPRHEDPHQVTSRREYFDPVRDSLRRSHSPREEPLVRRSHSPREEPLVRLRHEPQNQSPPSRYSLLPIPYPPPPPPPPRPRDGDRRSWFGLDQLFNAHTSTWELESVYRASRASRQ